jgi:hypothetical protein
LSLNEFKKGIEKAEKARFYSVEESKKMLLEWRKSDQLLFQSDYQLFSLL